MAEICVKAKGNNFTVKDLGDLFKSIPTTKRSILYLVYPFKSDIYIEVATDYTQATPSNVQSNIATITLTDTSNISVNDTLLVPGTYGFDETGTVMINREAILFVTGVDNEHNQIQCYCINGKKIGSYTQCVPTIDEGTPIILCGKAADNTIYPVTLNPKETSELFLLKFLHSFYEDSSKVKGRILNYGLMNNTEIEELRKFIIRKNLSYFMGVKGLDGQPNTMEGIWKIPKKEFLYNEQTIQDSIDKLFIKAFNGEYGHSDKKIILADTNLVAYLERTGKFNNKLECKSALGTLKFYHCPFLDELGWIGNGIVIDPAYIDIYVKTPLTGNFNNGVLTFTEESTIVMSNPRAHLRIVRA